MMKEHDIRFTIMGNPFYLNDQVCMELKGYGCEKYQLSIDGLRETHDWFRKPGSFDCTLEKIECINKAGIRSVIMTTVSKTNRMEVPGIIDEVVKAGANVFAFSRYVPSGCELDASMTAQEYRELLAICDKKFKEYEAKGCKTYFNKKADIQSENIRTNRSVVRILRRSLKREILLLMQAADNEA